LREGGDESVWRPVAVESIATMKDFAEKDSEWNFRHRYDLMRAELAAIDGDNEGALTAYQASIDKARKHAFANDLALATERIGLFFLDSGNPTEASNYLKQASQLYEAWGSIRKADHVMRKCPA
jgi:histidine kinase